MLFSINKEVVILLLALLETPQISPLNWWFWETAGMLLLDRHMHRLGGIFLVVFLFALCSVLSELFWLTLNLATSASLAREAYATFWCFPSSCVCHWRETFAVLSVCCSFYAVPWSGKSAEMECAVLFNNSSQCTTNCASRNTCCCAEIQNVVFCK